MTSRPLLTLSLVLVSGACAPNGPRLEPGVPLEGTLAQGPVKVGLPRGPVDVVLTPGRSGAQLWLVRGAERVRVEPRRNDAPKRVALASTDGVELEVTPPTPARGVVGFKLEARQEPRAEALERLDAEARRAREATVPVTAAALHQAAAQLLEVAQAAAALGDEARADEARVTAGEYLAHLSEPGAVPALTQASHSALGEVAGSALLELAAIDRVQGRLTQADAELKAARARAGDDALLAARVTVAEAQGLEQRAFHNQALALLLSVGPLVKAEAPADLLALYESTLGWAYVELGDRARALEHFTAEYAAAEGAKDGRVLGQALHDQATVLSNFDSNWKGALPFLLRAIDARREAGDRQGLAFSLDAAGEMESTLLDPGALPRHEEAFALRRAIGSVRGEAETLVSWGSAYGRLNRPAEAMAPLLRSVELFEQLGDHSWQAYASFRLGRAEDTAGHFEAALAWAQQAVRLTDSLRERIASEDRRAYYTASVRKYYDLWVASAAKAGKDAKPGELKWVEQALEGSERARARSLLDFLMLVGADRAAAPAALRSEQEALEDDIRRLESVVRSERADPDAFDGGAPHEDELEAKLGRYEALTAKAKVLDPRAASLQALPLVSLAEVQTLVGPQTLAVEYFLGRGGAYALVLAGGEPRAVPLGPMEPLTELAQRFAAALTTRNGGAPNEGAAARAARIAAADDEAERLRQKLRTTLVGPLERDLAGQRRLVVVADGALHLVPFAALVPELPVLSTPSFSVLKVQRAMKRPPPTTQLVALGDPVFEGDDARLKDAVAGNDDDELTRQGAPARLSRLVATRGEVEQLATLVPSGQASIWLDFEATKAKLREAGRPRLVHIATHGVLDTTHPEKSALVLSRRAKDGSTVDGTLSLAEIYGLSLPAELVTLSACETALGAEVRGEGLIGLARGFLHAGARSVLASLWKVNDRATAALMRAFYEGVLKLGLPPERALARAQQQVASNPAWRSPYYWAGFVLYGG